MLILAAGLWMAALSPAQVAAQAPVIDQLSHEELLAAAKAEGSVTWYVMLIREAVEPIAAEFEKKTGIKVTLVRLGTEELLGKFLVEAEAGKTEADVLYITGLPIDLRNKGLLARYTPQAVKDIGSEIASNFGAADGFWTPMALHFMIMTYNPQSIPPAQAPRKWTDLLDPKFSGKIVHADPAYSGSALYHVYYLAQKYGWEFFDKLARNDPMIVRGHGQISQMVQSGERPLAGEQNSQNVTYAKNRGDAPEVGIMPEDGALMIPITAAVPKNAPRPHAARLLVNWLLSKEAQQTVANVGGMYSVWENLPAPPGLPALNEVSGIATIDSLAAEASKAEVKDRFWEAMERN